MTTVHPKTSIQNLFHHRNLYEQTDNVSESLSVTTILLTTTNTDNSYRTTMTNANIDTTLRNKKIDM
jgi:hypothetical protein